MLRARPVLRSDADVALVQHVLLAKSVSREETEAAVSRAKPIRCLVVSACVERRFRGRVGWDTNVSAGSVSVLLRLAAQQNARAIFAANMSLLELSPTLLSAAQSAMDATRKHQISALEGIAVARVANFQVVSLSDETPPTLDKLVPQRVFRRKFVLRSAASARMRENVVLIVTFALLGKFVIKSLGVLVMR